MGWEKKGASRKDNHLLFNGKQKEVPPNQDSQDFSPLKKEHCAKNHSPKARASPGKPRQLAGPQPVDIHSPEHYDEVSEELDYFKDWMLLALCNA